MANQDDIHKKIFDPASFLKGIFAELGAPWGEMGTHYGEFGEEFGPEGADNMPKLQDYFNLEDHFNMDEWFSPGKLAASVLSDAIDGV